MVRGWNDTGSRISVRFADTAEQRELRRTERSAREGSVSPARLTIAQAALLNLHGQDFGIKPKSGPALQVPSSHMRRPQAHFPADPHALHYPASEFSSNAHIGNTGFAVDYSLAPQRMHTPPLIGTQQPYARSAGSRTMDPTMAALLNSLRNGAVPFQANNPYAHVDFLAQHYPAIVSNRNTRASMGKEAPPHLSDFSSNHQQGLDRGGYTATEEYILRAHANSNAERRKPPPLDLARRRRDTATNASIAMGLQGKRTHGAAFPSSTAHGQQYQQQKDAARVFSPIEPMDEWTRRSFMRPLLLAWGPWGGSRVGPWLDSRMTLPTHGLLRIAIRGLGLSRRNPRRMSSRRRPPGKLPKPHRTVISTSILMRPTRVRLHSHIAQPHPYHLRIRRTSATTSTAA
ncbi:hypothetical protein BD779DRAFT_282096 [Infundibulicybe gibba]|nr:hypothetical protein BD779DRAFT_282096 [Infundibulicybe gibba]